MKFSILVWPLLCLASVAVVEVEPLVSTQPAAFDVDDPAIWRNEKDPARSLIVGTVKRPRPHGGLQVYDLEGKLLEEVKDIDRPNNVDILGDLCVATERIQKQLRVYRVSASKPHLTLLGTVPVFAGQSGEASAPMGIALYERPKDKALFAIVSRKTGPKEGYLWQYRLRVEGGRVSGEKVREFGAFSGNGEIEAVAVDHWAGHVYYSDENTAVRIYAADPEAANANREIGQMATSGFQLNREGIAITKDWIFVTDQLDPRSEYHVYRRSDRQEMAKWRGQAQSTDGLDAIGLPMGPRFPKGFLIAMNNRDRNFQMYPLP